VSWANATDSVAIWIAEQISRAFHASLTSLMAAVGAGAALAALLAMGGRIEVPEVLMAVAAKFYETALRALATFRLRVLTAFVRWGLPSAVVRYLVRESNAHSSARIALKALGFYKLAKGAFKTVAGVPAPVYHYVASRLAKLGEEIPRRREEVLEYFVELASPRVAKVLRGLSLNVLPEEQAVGIARRLMSAVAKAYTGAAIVSTRLSLLEAYGLNYVVSTIAARALGEESLRYHPASIPDVVHFARRINERSVVGHAMLYASRNSARGLEDALGLVEGLYKLHPDIPWAVWMGEPHREAFVQPLASVIVRAYADAYEFLKSRALEGAFGWAKGSIDLAVPIAVSAPALMRFAKILSDRPPTEHLASVILGARRLRVAEGRSSWYAEVDVGAGAAIGRYVLDVIAQLQRARSEGAVDRNLLAKLGARSLSDVDRRIERLRELFHARVGRAYVTNDPSFVVVKEHLRKGEVVSPELTKRLAEVLRSAMEDPLDRARESIALLMAELGRTNPADPLVVRLSATYSAPEHDARAELVELAEALVREALSQKVLILRPEDLAVYKVHLQTLGLYEIARRGRVGKIDEALIASTLEAPTEEYAYVAPYVVRLFEGDFPVRVTDYRSASLVFEVQRGGITEVKVVEMPGAPQLSKLIDSYRSAQGGERQRIYEVIVDLARRISPRLALSGDPDEVVERLEEVVWAVRERSEAWIVETARGAVVLTGDLGEWLRSIGDYDRAVVRAVDRFNSYELIRVEGGIVEYSSRVVEVGGGGIRYRGLPVEKLPDPTALRGALSLIGPASLSHLLEGRLPEVDPAELKESIEVYVGGLGFETPAEVDAASMLATALADAYRKAVEEAAGLARGGDPHASFLALASSLYRNMRDGDRELARILLGSDDPYLLASVVLNSLSFNAEVARAFDLYVRTLELLERVGYVVNDVYKAIRELSSAALSSAYTLRADALAIGAVSMELARRYVIESAMRKIERAISELESLESSARASFVDLHDIYEVYHALRMLHRRLSHELASDQTF